MRRPEHKSDPLSAETLERILLHARERLRVEAMDRVWIFPPLVRGRKEWGLVAISCRTQEEGRRELFTARYAAELTGHGLRFEPRLSAEGSAPPEALPRVMDGVVRRSDLCLGEPWVVEIAGEEERFQALLAQVAEPHLSRPS